MSKWKTIKFPKSELHLNITLACGQSFRWSENRPGEWTSVLAGRVFTLKQTEDELLYRVYHAKHMQKDPKKQLQKRASASGDHASQRRSDNDESVLRDYFQMDVNLAELYRTWSRADANFKAVSTTFPGVRMLRQHPVENLFAFICSSNNNISRISGMVEKLCTRYGDKLLELEGHEHYSFPRVDTLAGDKVESELRDLGFGYRAKFISQSAKYIVDNHSEEWLFSLRSRPYHEAKEELMKMNGVGAKVADCVCLMSLDKQESVPVDTHVLQIAQRDYMPKLKTTKSISNTLYKEIGDHFRNLWGNYAGWAQSVLFSADLKKFQEKDESTQRGIKSPVKSSQSGDQKNTPNKKLKTNR